MFLIGCLIFILIGFSGVIKAFQTRTIGSSGNSWNESGFYDRGLALPESVVASTDTSEGSFELSKMQFFDDPLSSTEFTTAVSGDDDIGSTSMQGYNPATGLPMLTDTIDAGGSVFGTD